MSEIIRKLNNRNVIKLSHALNYARYDLGIVALDIIYMLIAQIKNEDTSFNEFNISVAELEKRMGRKLNRASLKKAKEELISEPIVFTKQNKNEPFPWIKFFELDVRLGLVRIELHPNLKEHLITPKLYAIGNLESVLALKSHYAKRLYMLCAQFSAMKKFTIGIKPLRDMLSTAESITRVYGNFKERVLETSIRIINESPDIKVKYSEIKTGRSITDLEFVVIKKRPEVKPKMYKKGVVAAESWLQRQTMSDDAIDVEVA